MADHPHYPKKTPKTVRENRAAALLRKPLIPFIVAMVILFASVAMLTAAPTQDTKTITTQAQFDEGTFSDTVSQNVSGGEVVLNGDGGAGWFDADWQRLLDIDGKPVF